MTTDFTLYRLTLKCQLAVQGRDFCAVRDGPDIVDMIVATWCNVAIPAIVAGCETIPFSDSTINEIDKVQSQVAKYALGLPIGAANVCAQAELGMKSFRQILFYIS